MLRFCRMRGFAILPLVCVSVGLIGHAQSPVPASSPKQTTQKTRTHSKKTPPPAEVPQTPPPPPTLEQQPPKPPQVTYRDGQLTINSSNATLSQVLRSVQSQTGA